PVLGGPATWGGRGAETRRPALVGRAPARTPGSGSAGVDRHGRGPGGPARISRWGRRGDADARSRRGPSAVGKTGFQAVIFLECGVSTPHSKTPSFPDRRHWGRQCRSRRRAGTQAAAPHLEPGVGTVRLVFDVADD